ncbi:hypothetical protein Nepgr_028124 [Nepenthes gracilis]|uniref:Uncharacterized protein n=1 Tax=Nepenthes gracilis TaxID=150966 RepID=A0AAD3Y488_NEPGR|nr:hypothetical protein Nepgr_028124 [Nepenthes gracilis]
MKNGIPTAPPLLNAAYNYIILPGLANGPQMMTQRVDNGIGSCKFRSQPRGKPISLIGKPLPEVLDLPAAPASHAAARELQLIGYDHVPRWPCY